MATESKGRDLFIVDNSVSGWTGLRYLEEWTSIAKAFDIATGYFEVGALLALNGKWKSLEKIRILLGSDMTVRTRKVLLQVVEHLNASMELSKDSNPFLEGVSEILAALRSGQIECRVYDKDKFHAKAYITHAKLEVVGSQALVGSSNFTVPGLTQNIELNIQVQSAREVAQLQEWFETHWAEGTQVTEAVIDSIDRQVRQYSPFDVYAKALQEYFRGHELTSSEWDETRSKMFPKIDRYQKEAYWALMKIARQHGGAFLCDGVGLGKTFVGLMLIERLILHEGKRVLLLAPKGAKEGVWEPHLREWLPHISGIGGDFSNLAVFNHTDLGREGEFPERFKRIAELADVVIIDEAHNFRNPGRRGDIAKGIDPSRYYLLDELLNKSSRQKTLFMLTATPVNNRLSDFRHMAELFTRCKEDYFSQTLGVTNLRVHFTKMETALRKLVGHDDSDVEDNLGAAQQILLKDEIFKNLVVQRSRSYAKESQTRESAKAAIFPERSVPKVAQYSIEKTYGALLEMVATAFERRDPLFTLPMYYPLNWYKGPSTGKSNVEEAFDNNRQKQLVGLIRTSFLKRFESSVVAFELSCDRLLRKLLAFLEVHSETPAEKKRLDHWMTRNSEILGYAVGRQLEFWVEGINNSVDEDIVPQEMLDKVEKLSRSEYDVAEMMSETFQDLEQVVQFLGETRKFKSKQDDKIQQLITLLKSKELLGQKVLIFTEFADTARYLKHELDNAGIKGVAQVDSATKGKRSQIIRRFAPYYNGSSLAALAAEGLPEIKVLISTDVLSEGLNLQDASLMMNYDIHWNPVRLMQRIGRVDRRMNPEIETRIKSDQPEIAASRGKVSFWNFLPPDDLNKLLSLYTKVTQKTLAISKTLGIEGRKLLTPEDDFDAIKEFNHAYEGTKTAVEDMHLEYQALLQIDPGLEARLKALPGATFSGRSRVTPGSRGVFFCYALPALDKQKDPPEFTEEAGTTRWYLYDLDRDDILEDPGEIVASIRSKPETPRRCITVSKTLMEIRSKIEKHIKNTYLKRVDAPFGVNPNLKCWMELNGD